MQFYLIPRSRLRLLAKHKYPQPRSEKGWDHALKAFADTKRFAAAKFFANLLANNGISPSEDSDLLTIEEVTCSATELLRILVNSRVRMTSSGKKFLEKLRSRGNMPEARTQTNTSISIDSQVFHSRQSSTV